VSNTIIVVPCHNEAHRLKTAKFRHFAASHNDISFLLVNDGSSDDTLALLHQLAAVTSTRFAVLNLAHNSGKAEAVRQGILHAAVKRPDYIGFWDADLATPLEAIPNFIAALDRRPEIAIVLGVRLQLLGHTIRRQPLRRLLGKAFARAASRVLGIRFHDTQCGAKMFRPSPEIVAAFSQPFDSRWIFDVELLARLIRIRRQTSQPAIGENIFEFPLEQWEDVAGSKLKRGDFVKAARELSAIWWRYSRPASPPFEANRPDMAPAAPRRAA
jgi:glycosyltransferase involved in cell wall biosynthesis